MVCHYYSTKRGTVQFTAYLRGRFGETEPAVPIAVQDEDRHNAIIFDVRDKYFEKLKFTMLFPVPPEKLTWDAGTQKLWSAVKKTLLYQTLIHKDSSAPQADIFRNFRNLKQDKTTC